MREITLEELLAAGCHFGHQVTRSNPKARDFIFEARDNIHIIDLAKTREWLEEAAEFVKTLASREGSTMIIVGTKRQARPTIEREVRRAKEKIKNPLVHEDLMYITSRWVGGLLTNFSEVSKNLKKLSDIIDLLSDDAKKSIYTKKELGGFDKEKEKLLGLYGGIAKIKKEPDAIFVIDSKLEELSVKEASKTGVSTVAIVDTNADPDLVDYPIPANDDAVGSIDIITTYIVDAWIEGKNSVKPKPESEEVKTNKKTNVSQGQDAKEKADKSLKKEESVKGKVDIQKPVKKTAAKTETKPKPKISKTK